MGRHPRYSGEGAKVQSHVARGQEGAPVVHLVKIPHQPFTPAACGFRPEQRWQEQQRPSRICRECEKAVK